MAVFTIAERFDSKRGENIRCEYLEESDVRTLLYYCMNKSLYTIYHKIYAFGVECIADQMIYLQRCRYKPFRNRAIHCILSFSSTKQEKHMTTDQIACFMEWMRLSYFREYQWIACLHRGKTGCLHIHIVINPINTIDLSLYRCNIFGLMKELADDLVGLYQVALQGVTYYDENGRLCKGSEEGAFLYQHSFWRYWGIG